jgi:hypothetical protein
MDPDLSALLQQPFLAGKPVMDEELPGDALDGRVGLKALILSLDDLHQLIKHLLQRRSVGRRFTIHGSFLSV